jgi:hypothetical protein
VAGETNLQKKNFHSDLYKIEREMESKRNLSEHRLCRIHYLPVLVGGLVFPAIHALEEANIAEPPTGSVKNNPFVLLMFVGELPALLPAVLLLKMNK